ncbi:hypothetical protein [Halarchaeum sp. P4]|uniref:hypothetical protein n=1 Tax=Halarchaeum sp. P4 TaxID=3421639 RepID=UPI003EBF5A6A
MPWLRHPNDDHRPVTAGKRHADVRALHPVRSSASNLIALVVIAVSFLPTALVARQTRD